MKIYIIQVIRNEKFNKIIGIVSFECLKFSYHNVYRYTMRPKSAYKYIKKFYTIGAEWTLSDLLSFNRWAMCMAYMCVCVCMFINNLGLAVEMYAVHFKSVAILTQQQHVHFGLSDLEFSKPTCLPFSFYSIFSESTFTSHGTIIFFFVSFSVHQVTIYGFSLYSVFNLAEVW